MLSYRRNAIKCEMWNAFNLWVINQSLKMQFQMLENHFVGMKITIKMWKWRKRWKFLVFNSFVTAKIEMMEVWMARQRWRCRARWQVNAPAQRKHITAIYDLIFLFYDHTNENVLNVFKLLFFLFRVLIDPGVENPPKCAIGRRKRCKNTF